VVKPRSGCGIPGSELVRSDRFRRIFERTGAIRFAREPGACPDRSKRSVHARCGAGSCAIAEPRSGSPRSGAGKAKRHAFHGIKRLGRGFLVFIGIERVVGIDIPVM
jgi:hypothetical protein